jgi:hypothetical protein
LHGKKPRDVVAGLFSFARVVVVRGSKIVYILCRTLIVQSTVKNILGAKEMVLWSGPPIYGAPVVLHEKQF